ncbi:hypothetical protein B0H13DRAFT_2660754 [Mycena leptocephala]|nr:hypothetical protein B0H13DRAFT_2660754 [Mycena leptocephala]
MGREGALQRESGEKNAPSQFFATTRSHPIAFALRRPSADALWAAGKSSLSFSTCSFLPAALAALCAHAHTAWSPFSPVPRYATPLDRRRLNYRPRQRQPCHSSIRPPSTRPPLPPSPSPINIPLPFHISPASVIYNEPCRFSSSHCLRPCRLYYRPRRPRYSSTLEPCSLRYASLDIVHLRNMAVRSTGGWLDFQSDSLRPALSLTLTFLLAPTTNEHSALSQLRWNSTGAHASLRKLLCPARHTMRMELILGGPALVPQALPFLHRGRQRLASTPHWKSCCDVDSQRSACQQL